MYLNLFFKNFSKENNKNLSLYNLNNWKRMVKINQENQ